VLGALGLPDQGGAHDVIILSRYLVSMFTLALLVSAYVLSVMMLIGADHYFWAGVTAVLGVGLGWVAIFLLAHWTVVDPSRRKAHDCNDH
jgi:hypothetical protein